MGSMLCLHLLPCLPSSARTTSFQASSICLWAHLSDCDSATPGKRASSHRFAAFLSHVSQSLSTNLDKGVGGIRLVTPEFMQGLRELCDKYDTVLICDEIQCGYGRSGKFFAHQHTGIRPDIITVAKGIGNGFPMGGVLISPKFTPVYGQLGTTFGGNHLACAAAIAVLDVMKQDNLVENAAKVGAYLMEELKKFPQIKEVRGQGLMIGMEFEEPIKDIRRKLLFEKKVFTGVSGTNVIRLLPPLCLSMEEAEEFLKRFKEVL